MKPEGQEAMRAWVIARVQEAGGIDAARPDNFTQKAWRALCHHLQVKPKKVSTLEDALRAVAELAGP